MLWAGRNDDGETDWFDVTDALIDPRTFQFGIGKDSIPSIDEPKFAPLGDDRLAKAGIDEDTMVIGYSAEGPLINGDRPRVPGSIRSLAARHEPSIGSAAQKGNTPRHCAGMLSASG